MFSAELVDLGLLISPVNESVFEATTDLVLQVVFVLLLGKLGKSFCRGRDDFVLY